MQGRKLPASIPKTGEVPVYAVTGPTAGTVAYNLAGLLARATKDEGKRVLLVDAEGRVSREVLSGVSCQPTDKLVAGGDLSDCLIHDTHSGLRALLHPQKGSLPANGIVGRLRAEFDAVVVACGDSRYAIDWLRAADRVVVSGSNARGLGDALRHAEELRGRDGALLAPMGRPKLSGDSAKRRLFRLPSVKNKAFEAAEQACSFATLVDEEVGRAFEPLLEELLNGTGEGRQDRSRPSWRRESNQGGWGASGNNAAEEPPARPAIVSPKARSEARHATPDGGLDVPFDGTEGTPSLEAEKRPSADGVLERMRRGAQQLEDDEDEFDEEELEREDDGKSFPGFLREVSELVRRYWYYLAGAVVALVVLFLLLTALFGGEGSGKVRDTDVVVGTEPGDGGNAATVTVGEETWTVSTEDIEDGKVTTLEGPTVAQFKEGFELPGGGSITTGVFAEADSEEPIVHATFHRLEKQDGERTGGNYYAVEDGEVVAEGSYADERDGEEVTRTYTERVGNGEEKTYRVRFDAPEGTLIPQLLGWERLEKFSSEDEEG